jgi:hypothetical protein
MLAVHPETMKNTLCYVSGKIGGLSAMTALINFRGASDEVRNMGRTPIDPCDAFSDLPLKYWQFMVLDIILLSFCGAIYLQRNWQQSKGAKIEYKFAKLMGKQILYQQ